MSDNASRLEKFNATKSIGVKKRESTKFIYDEAGRCFVIVKGPEADFKEQNPIVIDFDQVIDAFVEVEEYWTKTDNKFDNIPGYGTLLQKDYDQVVWRYNVYMNIVTDNPEVGAIRYAININPVRIKIPYEQIIVRRGLELNGIFRGKAIKEEAQRLEELAVKEADKIKKGKAYESLTGQRPDGILDRLIEDFKDDKYVSRIVNLSRHMNRGWRIQRILKNK